MLCVDIQIAQEFQELAPVYQEVISDICCKMGSGMTVFLDRGVGSLEEWNEVSTAAASLKTVKQPNTQTDRQTDR